MTSGYLKQKAHSYNEKKLVNEVKKLAGVSSLNEGELNWIRYSFGNITGSMVRKYGGDVGLKNLAKSLSKDIKYFRRKKKK